MKPLGDRRRRVRLDIVGSLWATLELSEVGRLLDISPMGALIASPVPLPADSTQVIRLTLGGSELTVEARVCHLRQNEATPDQPREYLVGLEFLAVPAGWADAFS